MKDVSANFLMISICKFVPLVRTNFLSWNGNLKSKKRRATRMFCALTGKEPMIKLKNLKLLSIQKYNVNIL
ncbi:hypothetical protein HUSEC_14703 [Escherichia coli O104:H4 str. LB226692]|nr:hypothetical protein HUSEC_14703 [Escherichia coli O104:H4 str. LB226692]